MAKKYELLNTFLPVNNISAYILGFAWADGHINSERTRFAIASKDNEIEEIRDYFYGCNRPLHYRENGVKILCVDSVGIVKELESFGFTSNKSYAGVPQIPKGFESYFLLGLLDGDGCISVGNVHNSVVLRVYFCGSKDSMLLIQQVIKNITGVQFSLRERKSSGESLSILGIETTRQPIFYVLDCHHTKHSISFLSWLYKDTEGLPFLQRKYKKFIDFLSNYDTTKMCPLCNRVFEYISTQEYCNDCRILLRRLRNRQQDHLNRNGIRYSLSELLKPEEYNVNDWLLDTLGRD